MTDLDFKMSADTPLVSRSQFIEHGRAIVIGGDQFEDGKQRFVVSMAVRDEEVASITDYLSEAEVKRAMFAEQVAIIERLTSRSPFAHD